MSTDSNLSLLVAATFAAIALAAPRAVSAELSLQTDELGSYDIPEGFLDTEEPRISSTRDGRTLMAATTGDGETFDCTIVVVEDAEATAFDYRYGEALTACLGVEAHPEGGFFVRAFDAEALQEEEVSGITARLDDEGEEVWSLHDEEFADDQEFTGSYAQPNPAMAYSAEYDRLLAFSEGAISGGGSSALVSQGHILDAESGDLFRVGWEPKEGGNPGLLAEATARTSDGYFLVYVYSEGEQGAYFFAYNGTNNEAFYPLEEQDAWTERVVRRMVHGPDEHIHLMWTPDAGEDETPPTEISVVDQDDASEVWTKRWEATAEVDFADEAVDLGTPQGMWVGAEYTLLLYQVDDQYAIRVVDATDGTELGVASLSELVDDQLLQVLNDGDGGFKLLTVDKDEGVFTELELSIEADEEEDSSDDENSSEDEGDDEDRGCAAGSSSSPVPLTGALLVLAVAVFTIARRRFFCRLERSVHDG